MSSASSGRYQSRIFNFVYQQSRRLTEQCERALREFQVATSWVAPVVLYPIYLLFRSTRAAVKQVHQAVQKSRPQLQASNDADPQPQTPPTADTPIQRVSSHPPILYPYQALGFLDRTVAKLESNYLVPVSKVALALGKRNWKLVRRVQSQLNVSRKSSAIAADGCDTHTSSIQALIWAAINYFFGHRGGSELTQTTRTNSSKELSAGSKPRCKPLPHRHSASKLPYSQAPSRAQLVSTNVDPWLTLGDLFGEPESSLQTSTKSQTTTQPPGKTNPALPASQSALGGHPWNLLNNLQTFLSQLKQASGLVLRHGSLAEEEFSRQLPQKTTRSVTRTQKTAKTVAITCTKGGTSASTVSQSRGDRIVEISHQPHSQSTQLDPAPDWLDIHATAMGYVKHPLEQLLEWLDRAMLWLEDVSIVFWRWVQQLWRGK